MAFKEVFEKHQEGKGPKKSKDPLEELIMNYITRFRKKKSKKVVPEVKEEEKPADDTCKWCQGTGINPKDKKQEKYCRYCGGSGKLQAKKKKKKIDTAADNLNSNNC